MARQITVRTIHGEIIDYTMIETVEDIGQVPCFGPDEDLIKRFNEGRIIIVNDMGGYCFFEEDFHTIIS